MSEMLGALISGKTRIEVSELAHLGNTYDSQDRTILLSDEKVESPCVLLFYEGNDLNGIKESSIKRFLFSFPPVAAFARLKLRKSQNTVSIDLSTEVKQTFLLDSIKSMLADSKISNLEFCLNQDHFCRIWIAPTSHAVTKDDNSALSRHRSLLKQVHQTKAINKELINLTDTLRKSHKKRIDAWWRNDTHWKRDGILLHAEYLVNKSVCITKAKRTANALEGLMVSSS